MRETEISITLDGGVIVGHRGGTGPAALVLHGGPAFPDYMGGCADLLADRLDCIRYTQRGVAPSAEVPPYTIETHVADAVRVLDTLGVDQAWLVGHSWGGQLALHVLLAHPDRATGLICIDPLSAYDVFEPFGRNLRSRLTPEAQARVDEIEARRRAGEATYEELQERGMLIWPAFFVDPATSVSVVPERVGVQCSTETNRSISEHYAAGTLPNGLPGVPELPALFVHGRESPMPLESSTETAKLLPGARVVLIDGAGHYPWVECPDAFRDAVFGFLDSLSS